MSVHDKALVRNVRSGMDSTRTIALYINVEGENKKNNSKKRMQPRLLLSTENY